MKWEDGLISEGGTLQVPTSWLLPHYYEALTLLFRIENALRLFVYLILKTAHRDQWTNVQILGEGQDTEGTIASLANKRMSQSESFGYLGYPITCPIMHLTSGELTRLMVSETSWPLFKSHFLGKKEIIRNKLDEIGSIRNSMAHFRPVSKDDVQVIRQNAQHVMAGIERFLSQALVQQDAVPTNTDDKWYAELRTLGTDHCSIGFGQSANERWIRLTLTYDCPILKKQRVWKNLIRYHVLTINSSAILRHYSELARNAPFLCEDVPYTRMGEELSPAFRKLVALVFAREILEQNWEAIKQDMATLLKDISQETEFIQQDNLARGKVVIAVTPSATASETQGKVSWNINTVPLMTPVVESDPAEYWGDLAFYGWADIIAKSNRYPWMPVEICQSEVPF